MAKAAVPRDFVPTLREVIRMAPKLNAWATMAAKEYAIYAGINHAIKKAKDKSTPLPHHGSELRQIAAMMCIVHLFATLDRDANISLQSAHRYLKRPAAIDEIAENYAQIPPSFGLSSARRECQESIDRFNTWYAKIDFKVFGKLQSFRNSSIAHIVWSDALKVLRYGELETLVEIVCNLAGELSSFTAGKNDWPIEHKNQLFDDTVVYWTAIFSADATDLLEYGSKAMLKNPTQA